MRSAGDIRFEADSDGDIVIRDHLTFPALLCGWIYTPENDATHHDVFLMGRVIDAVPKDRVCRFPPTAAGLESAKDWARDTLMGVKETA